MISAKNGQACSRLPLNRQNQPVSDRRSRTLRPDLTDPDMKGRVRYRIGSERRRLLAEARENGPRSAGRVRWFGVVRRSLQASDSKGRVRLWSIFTKIDKAISCWPETAGPRQA